MYFILQENSTNIDILIMDFKQKYFSINSLYINYVGSALTMKGFKMWMFQGLLHTKGNKFFLNFQTIEQILYQFKKKDTFQLTYHSHQNNYIHQ